MAAYSRYMQIPPAIDLFLTELVNTKQQGRQISDESKAEMKADLLPRLHKWLILKAMTELAKQNPQHVAELRAMMERNADATEVQKFMTDKIPNGESFLAQTLVEFRNTYLGN